MTPTPASESKGCLRPEIIAAVITALGGIIVAAITIVPDLLENAREPTPTPTMTATAAVVEAVPQVATQLVAAPTANDAIARPTKTASTQPPAATAAPSAATEPTAAPPTTAPIARPTVTPTAVPPTVAPALPITAGNAPALAEALVIKPFGGPYDIGIAPDGRRLIVGTAFKVLVYDLAQPDKPLFEMGEAGKSVACLALTADGALLATGGSSFDGTIRLWNMAAGGVLRKTIAAHTENIFDVAFNPAGALLASASRDKSLRVWDVASGDQVFQSMAHKDWVHAVAFSPDGATLASGGGDAMIRVWDVAGWQETRQLPAHEVSVDAIAFSSSQPIMASAGQYDPAVQLWSTESWEPVLVLRGHEKVAGYGVFSLAISPDGSLLASGGGDYTVRVWDIAAGSPTYGTALAVLEGHSDWPSSLIFTRDGSTLVSASERDGTIRLWQVPPAGS